MSRLLDEFQPDGKVIKLPTTELLVTCRRCYTQNGKHVAYTAESIPDAKVWWHEHTASTEHVEHLNPAPHWIGQHLDKVAARDALRKHAAEVGHRATRQGRYWTCQCGAGRRRHSGGEARDEMVAHMEEATRRR